MGHCFVVFMGSHADKPELSWYSGSVSVKLTKQIILRNRVLMMGNMSVMTEV